MSRYVVIKEKSAGNDTVGEMWKETKIFSGDATVKEIMKWAGEGNERMSRKTNIILTMADNDELDVTHICEGCGTAGWTGKCGKCIPW